MNNFDYKKYLKEGRLLKEGFEIGDIVKFSYIGINKSPKSRMEIIDRRKMFGSDLMAYIVKKDDGSTAEYDETQLTAAPTMWRPNSRDLKEDITITGEYQGEPVISSGGPLEEYLIEIMSLAISAEDFVRKVEYGLTDETSSLSKEDQAKLIQFYTDNIQHFDKMGYNPIGKTEKSSEPNATDFDRLVDELKKNNIPSNVILGVDGRIDIELGWDYPESLAIKVFDILDSTGIEADVSADVTTQEARNQRTNGGPRRDWEREDDEKEMDFKDLWETMDMDESITESFFTGHVDQIAQAEFGMDYDQLGPGEKEWVRDEIDNMSESVSEEMDLNDPALMKARAAKMKHDRLAKIPKIDFKKAYREADKKAKNSAKIALLKKERDQLMNDMEQEAEPEGGPIANRYGRQLNRIDKALAKLSGTKDWSTMTYQQVKALDENEAEKILTSRNKLEQTLNDIADELTDDQVDTISNMIVNLSSEIKKTLKK